MKKIGHSITGFQLGVVLGFASYKFLHFNLLSCILIVYCTYKGSNAPDFLEISWFDKEKMIRRSLIKHRTYTHWALMWFVLFFLCVYGYLTHSLNWIYPLAFVLGAFLHLLMDWPNPSGVPFLYPTRRKKSLKWWKSGENEGVICFFTGLIMLGLVYWINQSEIHQLIEQPHTVFKGLATQLLYDTKSFFQSAVDFIRNLIA